MDNLLIVFCAGVAMNTRSISRILAIGLFTCALPCAVFAGDLQKNPTIDHNHNWSGFSFGVGIVGSTIDNTFDMTATRGVPNHPNFGALSIVSSASSHDNDSWDASGTAQIAYDRMMNERLLLGAFADYDFGSNSSSSANRLDDNPQVNFTNGNPNFGPELNLRGRSKTDELWTVGGRLGWKIRPRLLAYGLAGFTRVKASGTFAGSYEDNFTAVDLPTLQFNDWLNGFTVGGGAELALTQELSLKIEYRYARYSGKSASITSEYDDFGVSNRDTMSARMNDLERHSIRALIVFNLDDIRHDPQYVALK